MNDDLFDIDPNAPIDKAFINETKTALKTMTVDMVKGKMEEAKLLEESMRNGGPGGMNEAIWHLMDSCDIGIRALAVKSGINRKKLVRMIEGEIPITKEVTDAVYDLANRKRPDLFKGQ